jgi:hypothetical protein
MADTPGDSVGRLCQPRRLSGFAETSLHLPNRFAAYERPHRASFELPAVERAVAGGRFKAIDADCPFQFRINKRNIGARTD